MNAANKSDSKDYDVPILFPANVAGSSAATASREAAAELELSKIFDRVWNQAREKDPSKWFQSAVKKSDAPTYYTLVRRPMDMGKIHAKIRRRDYKNRKGFLEDFRQIAINALMFNGPKSSIYTQATDVRNCVLELLKDRSGEIAPFEQVLESWTENALNDDVSESIRDTAAVEAAKQENERLGEVDDTQLNAASAAAFRQGRSGGGGGSSSSAAGGGAAGAVDRDLLLVWSKTKMKKSNAGMLPCTSVHRVCPVDVQAAATNCLFKHLLSGNLQLLGYNVASAGAKVASGGGKASNDSHFLMNHKGEVFLHFLDTAHTLLEAVPPIDKVGGGVVNDYRVDALRSMAKHNMLMGAQAGTQRMPRQQLIHETKYFPLTRSEGSAMEHPKLAPMFAVLRGLSVDRLSLEQCIKSATHFFGCMQHNSDDFFPELSDRKRLQAYGQRNPLSNR